MDGLGDSLTDEVKDLLELRFVSIVKYCEIV